MTGMELHEWNFPFQGPPKFTQMGIFCLKINHLATLVLKLSSEAAIKPKVETWNGSAATHENFRPCCLPMQIRAILSS
jgi:hypothetical protein